MKKTVVILIALLIGTTAYSQKVKEKNVPNVVKMAFSKAYPNADDIEWEKEGTNYEVEFETDEVEYSVLYDANGVLIETEIEIKNSQLPEKVKEYLKVNYANKKIREASKITDAKGIVTYEAEIKGIDLIFDANGNFVKEVKKQTKD